jgi:hypothetical protein
VRILMVVGIALLAAGFILCVLVFGGVVDLDGLGSLGPFARYGLFGLGLVFVAVELFGGLDFKSKSFRKKDGV